MLVGYVLYCIECAREIYVCSRFNAYILLIYYAVCDFDTGAIARIEFHASYGYIRFIDSSCGLHVPSSSRDSLLPHISDSRGG